MSSLPSYSVSPVENQPHEPAIASPRFLGWAPETLMLTPLEGENEWREHFQTEIGPSLPSLIRPPPTFEADSVKKQQEIQQKIQQEIEWQQNPLPLSLLEQRQEIWWENALEGSVCARGKRIQESRKVYVGQGRKQKKNETDIHSPSYFVAEVKRSLWDWPMSEKSGVDRYRT